MNCYELGRKCASGDYSVSGMLNAGMTEPPIQIEPTDPAAVAAYEAKTYGPSTPAPKPVGPAPVYGKASVGSNPNFKGVLKPKVNANVWPPKPHML